MSGYGPGGGGYPPQQQQQGGYPFPQASFMPSDNQHYTTPTYTQQQLPQQPPQHVPQPQPPPPPPQQYSYPAPSLPQYPSIPNSSTPQFQQPPPNSSPYPQSAPSQTGSEHIDVNIESVPPKRYGEAPKVQPRRYKTQQVKLSEGNLVIECPVPSNLLALVPEKGEKEFKYLRYTACTCDPDEFFDRRYSLRQKEDGRLTELFIVITMYNEDEKLFARTFEGVVKNIHKLCNRENSKMWTKEGWKKIVVCVVSDGRNKINKRTQDYLAAIGVYQRGVAKEKINEEKVTAHIFEYTTQLCLDSDMKPVGAKYEYTPVQVLFCLKEENKKKINSHRWFFNAFGRVLKPTICVLLDVGTRPGGNSIYHLWKAFENSYVGGACGEIVAMKGKRGGLLLKNPLVASQNFEYKMSNILDKPLESVFGYITVLPGAFSAYRYAALENAVDPVTGEEVGPLASYFMGEAHHGGGPPKKKKRINDDNNEKSLEDGEYEEKEIKTGLFTANMYLAEDRILCFELVSKRGSSWLLHYVKSAYAETDVPDTFTELISQRRRWLNGSFFAGVYAVCHTFNLWRSHHTPWRKTVLLIEMLYQTFNLVFSWTALGNLYLTFHILGNSIAVDPMWNGGRAGIIIFDLLKYVYIALIILQFALALGNKPRSAKWAYVFSTYFFAVLMIYMLFAAAWLTRRGIDKSLADIEEERLRNEQGELGLDVSSANSILKNFTFSTIVLSVISTYGLYFIASFLFFEPYHMFHSSVQYMLLLPFYVNVLTVYAFCNIHDISWGTKGDTKPAEALGQVKTSNQESNAEVELPEDINEEYERVQTELTTIRKEKKQKDKKNLSDKEKEELKEEKNAMFRTYVVFFWILSNGALIAAITNVNPLLNSNAYFAFILWSVAGLAAFRFIGSCIYLILRLFTENIWDGCCKFK